MPAPAATEPCAPAAPPATQAGSPAAPDTSAATKFGWGKPNRVDDFTNGIGKGWDVYDGPGHDGKGRRTPDAVTVSGGIMTITGDSNGATAGMAWDPGQKYGRWEGRVKAPVGDSSYNALMLLWPDAENWPVGGEVDFMEMSDDSRQSTNMFLHYGSDNSQESGEVKIDATQWHDWAVEWTPTHIAAFVDGKQWWRTTDVNILPPGPMHLCIQLDWFPEGGTVKKSSMLVDWVKQYPISVGDVVKDAPKDVGKAVESVGNVAGSLVEGIADAATRAILPQRRVTAPMTEGWPDPIPARKGLVDHAVAGGR